MSISFTPADYSPNLSGYTGQGAFRFWCQKVLPIVYDDSLSYYELLNKVVVYLNNVISDVATVEENVSDLSGAYSSLQKYVNDHTEELISAYNQLEEYVNNYFANLDVQNEINNKLDAMASDGSLTGLLISALGETIPETVAEWLENNITPTSPPIDRSLSVSGAGADSKMAGEIFNSSFLMNIGSNLISGWEIGGIDTTTGETTTDTKRARTQNFIDCSNKNLGLFNFNSETYLIAIMYYDENYNYTGLASWNVIANKTLESQSSTRRYCKLTVRTDPESTLEGGDISVINNVVKVGVISGLFDCLSDYTEPTANLWNYGDIVCDGPVYLENVYLPAGDYILHADITRNPTGRCRIVFWESRLYNKLAEPFLDYGSNYPQYAKFSLASDCNFISVYGGLSDADTTHTEWNNIQIFSGNTILPYESNPSLIDSHLRGFTDKLVKSYNLWPYGDVEFTQRFSSNEVNLPFYLEAGTYVISALAKSYRIVNDNEVEAYNQTVRVYIMDENGGTLADITTLNRNVHSSAKFTIARPAYRIALYASNTLANSADSHSIWKDIQIVKGSFSKPYVKYYEPDSVLNHIAKTDTFFEEENVTLEGNRTWNFNIIRDRIDDRNVIVSIDAYYEGTPSDDYNKPRFSVYYTTGDQGTTWYYLCGENQATPKEIRMPPFPGYTGTYENTMFMRIYIPNGLTVHIRKISYRYSNEITRGDCGCKLAAHGSFMFYPQHSVPAVLNAAKCGAEKCIVIPKVSSDGVWFAYHDDTFDVSSTILRNPDGTRIAESIYDGLYFNDIPFSYLEQFDSGVSKSTAFSGLKLMKINEYLRICGKTGMKPYFSLHPVTRMGESVLEGLMSLVENYGLLSKLSLKPADHDYLYTTVFPVFGNNIEEYCLLNHLGQDADENITDMINSFNICVGLGLDTTKVRCTIELWQPDVTIERVNRIKAAGFNVSCVSETHTSQEGVANYYYITEGDYNYLQSIGISEFTVNHNPSFGLNW